MNKILETKNVTKNYHTKNGEIEAITNISLDVFDKEFISIVGSSGCGKSSFLNILAGLEEKSTGEIKFIKENPIIGYMLQTDSLLPWLTVLENACLGLRIKKIDTQKNINYVKKLLKTYGLKEFINKYPTELSGGMKQRVV